MRRYDASFGFGTLASTGHCIEQGGWKLDIDFACISHELRYKLLVSFVAPRPIALVTSRSPDGINNAAPISFFNAFSDTPPLLLIGLQHKKGGAPKDTTANIVNTGEFVVNLVDERIARQMVICGIDFPSEVDEVKAAGLSLEKSFTVEPGWVGEAPVAFECRLERVVELPNRCIVFGHVTYMHVRDDCIDSRTLRVRPENYCPIARLHGDNYISAKNQYVLTKATYEEWLTRNGEEPSETRDITAPLA